MTFKFSLLICAVAGALYGQPAPDIQTLQVRNGANGTGVYMITGDGGNITVQVGSQGVLMVDTGLAGDTLAPRVMAEIRKLSKGPIHYIINTHVHPDHVGGNEAFAKLIPPNRAQPLLVIAQENVLNRMTKPVTGNETPPYQLGLPTDEYYLPFKDLHYNGEAIIIYHEPNAHTDGDSVVLFRGSDVVSAGDIFTPEGYPFIDLERGGSVLGEIAALNHILDLTVPEDKQEGGTLVIPGHGHLCEEAEVVEYRDMIVIVKDRIADMLKKGMNLAQIKAAQPTLDYDTQYVSPNSFVKTDQFIEAVYKSLGGK
jgi:glyoxylase-like metal-dependent hydrolase (beta-lactamase superfamily II)